MNTNESPGLFTDRYELTMLDAALQSGVAHKQATFEVFARKLPEGRRYGVIAGTQRLIDYLPDFLNGLSELSFLSDEAKTYIETKKEQGYPIKVSGYQEGETYFPYSPILTVEGEFGMAVLIETLALSILNHDCAIAGAAARMVTAARGKKVSDLGARRTHEEAAVAAARAAYITGFAGTSDIMATHRYGVPSFGTSAHAFTLAHNSEEEAFKAQVAAQGVGTTLLVDTYDIADGIRTAVKVAGPELGAIRIDSGDLREETLKARDLLDSLGATKTKIVVSSDLDEYALDELHDTGAPIDSFGIGTRLVTGSGHPTASMVYKLVAIENEDGTMRPVAKKSSNKKSVGGRKNAYRVLDKNGKVVAEGFTLNDEAPVLNDEHTARQLQVMFWDNGVQTSFTMDEMRNHHTFAMAELPESVLQITAGETLLEVGQA